MCHKLAGNIITWCEQISELDEYGHVKAVYGMDYRRSECDERVL